MTKKLKPEQAKKLAYSIFINEDRSWVEIAEIVGYTAVSVGNWAKDGKWRELKEALTSVSDNQLQKFVSQLNELNKKIQKREEGERYPNSKEADTQMKLTKAILLFKGEADITDILQYSKLFLSFLRANYPDRLKEYALMFDQFIKEKV